MKDNIHKFITFPAFQIYGLSYVHLHLNCFIFGLFFPSVLDEATSALDVAWEIRLYSACKELGITVVSVGHRKSLREVCNSCDSYTLCPYVPALC